MATLLRKPWEILKEFLADVQTLPSRTSRARVGPNGQLEHFLSANSQ
jgi:hypothetical protein